MFPLYNLVSLGCGFKWYANTTNYDFDLLIIRRVT